MNHDQIKSKLFEYYDAELPESGQKEIASHLAGCKECSLELRAWNKAAGIFFKREEVALNESFTRKVMSEIARREESAALSPSPLFDLSLLFQWKVAAAVSFVLMFLIYTTISRPLPQEDVHIETVLLPEDGNGQAGSESWLFLENQIGKDELMLAVLENGTGAEI